MKKMILAAAMALGCGLVAFGETWTDAKGVTWDFYADYTDDNVFEAEITGVSPAPSGAHGHNCIHTGHWDSGNL